MTILNRLAAYKTTLKWSPIMAQRSGVPELGLMTQMSAQHQESITQALRPFSLVSEPNLTGFNPTSIHNDDFLNPVLQPRTPFLTAAEIANPATISQPRREFIKILSWYQKTAFSYLNKRDRQKAVRQGSDLIIRAFLMAEEAHAGVPRNM